VSQETQTREIGGRTFTVTQLPPRRALKLLRRVVAVLGPPLAQGLSATSGRGLKEVDLTALAPALEKLFEQLDDAELDALIDGALATARLDGKEVLPVFDLVFRGRLPDVFKLLVFALEVHFADFFDGTGGGLLDALKAFASRTSTTSSGPSGASSSPA
jgi:hypothetical protein